MKLPADIIDIISSFNGSQNELNTERGLRFMFLQTGKFFSWGDDREKTIHRFLELYDIRKCQELVKRLLKDEINWESKESFWATEIVVKKLLNNIR